ncbi:hypothetical protein D3C85_1223060 [compost metagenome]
MQGRALDVDVLGVPTCQNPEHQDVDQQPRDGDGQHRPGQNHGRLLEALPGLVDDPGDNGEKRDGVDEAGDHLEAEVAEGSPGIGQAPAKAEGEIGQAERRRVGQHMAGVRQQGQRARNQSPDHLDDHEGEDQGKRQQDLALIVPGDGRRVVVIVARVVMTGVAVTLMCVRHGMPLGRKKTDI